MLKYIFPYAQSDKDDAGSGVTPPFPAQTPPAMAYVPFQQWEEPYAPNKALAAGTMFPSLDLPFTGSEVRL